MMIRSVLVAVLVTSLIAGGLWALDEYGDRRVEKAKVAWDADQEQKRLAAEEAARQAGEEAEAARRSAQRPGSLARLIKEFCRDCQ